MKTTFGALSVGDKFDVFPNPDSLYEKINESECCCIPRHKYRNLVYKLNPTDKIYVSSTLLFSDLKNGEQYTSSDDTTVFTKTDFSHAGSTNNSFYLDCFKKVCGVTHMPDMPVKRMLTFADLKNGDEYTVEGTQGSFIKVVDLNSEFADTCYTSFYKGPSGVAFRGHKPDQIVRKI